VPRGIVRHTNAGRDVAPFTASFVAARLARTQYESEHFLRRAAPAQHLGRIGTRECNLPEPLYLFAEKSESSAAILCAAHASAGARRRGTPFRASIDRGYWRSISRVNVATARVATAPGAPTGLTDENAQ
jgi:hypothetical protein